MLAVVSHSLIMELVKSCLDLVCKQMKEKQELTKLKFHPKFTFKNKPLCSTLERTFKQCTNGCNQSIKNPEVILHCYIWFVGDSEQVC